MSQHQSYQTWANVSSTKNPGNKQIIYHLWNRNINFNIALPRGFQFLGEHTLKLKSNHFQTYSNLESRVLNVSCPHLHNMYMYMCIQICKYSTCQSRSQVALFLLVPGAASTCHWAINIHNACKLTRNYAFTAG